MSDPQTAKATIKLQKAQLKAYNKLAKLVNKYNHSIEKQHQDWELRRNRMAENLDMIQNPDGGSANIMLHPDEKVIGSFSANLIEFRAGPSQYVGGHSGFSVPVASIGGHSIRYNFGTSHGHIEKSAPRATVIDAGEFVITNQRMVFVGQQQSRECPYPKVISTDNPYSNQTSIALSNRKTPVIIQYAEADSYAIRMATYVGTSEFQGNTAALLAGAEQELDEIIKSEPAALAMPSLDQAIRDDFVIPALGNSSQAFSLKHPEYANARWGVTPATATAAAPMAAPAQPAAPSKIATEPQVQPDIVQAEFMPQAATPGSSPAGPAAPVAPSTHVNPAADPHLPPLRPRPAYNWRRNITKPIAPGIVTLTAIVCLALANIVVVNVIFALLVSGEWVWSLKHPTASKLSKTFAGFMTLVFLMATYRYYVPLKQ